MVEAAVLDHKAKIRFKMAEITMRADLPPQTEKRNGERRFFRNLQSFSTGSIMFLMNVLPYG